LQAQSKLTQQSSLIAASDAQVASTPGQPGSLTDRPEPRRDLAQTRLRLGERVTTLSADAHIARSQLAKAQADAQGQRQQINALTAEIKRLDAQIANAKTDLAQAELNLTRSEIRARSAA
jgi:membrane fusion protein (multidrug efflux system)